MSATAHDEVSVTFSHLFSPIQVGSLLLPNRIVGCTHGPGLSLDPHEDPPGRRYGHYLARRARGGAAVVTTGTSYTLLRAVNHGGKLSFMIGGGPFMWPAGERGTAAEEKYVAYLGGIAHKVHEAGGRLFSELSVTPSRSGAYGYSGVYSVDYFHLSASPTPTVMGGMSAREISAAEIEAMGVALGELAAIARSTGIDGLELHAHAGDLHSDFMSPVVNRRRDDYGGDLENRGRFTREMIAAVRARIGAEFPLWMRFSPVEKLRGGLTLDDGARILARIEEDGGIDAFNIYGAMPNSTGGGTPDMTYPVAVNAPYSARVRAVLSGTPVICGGRINDPETAEELLADGTADLIGMVRALIADPDLPNKARLGRVTELRRCCYSSEGCIALLNQTRVPSIVCTVNPETGREADPPPPPATRVKRVLVIGAGPAGLKAAEQAAERGHEVVVCEREAVAGGQVTLQSQVASRRLEQLVVDNLLHRLDVLGVQLRFDVEIDAAAVLEHSPDAVIVATGARSVKTGFTNLVADLPGLPGADLDHVLTDTELLRGAAVGSNVVVVESNIGDFSAPVCVEYLLDRGHTVTAVTDNATIGAEILFRSQRPLLARLYGAGMTMRAHTGVSRIRPAELELYNVHSDAPTTIDAVDSVVLVLGRRSEVGLADALRASVPEVFEVGDAFMPRGVGSATLEGWQIGRTL